MKPVVVRRIARADGETIAANAAPRKSARAPG
jgi:hypothetical protein